MSPSPEIERQIQELVDGHLSGEEERQLVDRIGNDPELVDLLVSYTGLDISISLALRFSPEDFRKVKTTMRKTRPKPWIRVALATAAVLTFLLAVLWLVIPPDTPPLVVLRGAPGTNFEISKTGDTPRDKDVPGLFAGDRLLISQGVMELEFESGVKAIIQAPAELQLEHDHFALLVRGRAWFRVPPQMSGFRVATEDVRAIDLGTEFTVVVIEDGPDEVHVIEGRVDVSPIGNPERGQVVRAKQARSVIRKGLLQTVPYRGSSFLSELPAGLPYLHFPMETGADGSMVIHGDINGEAGVRGRFVPDASRSRSVGPVSGRFGGALGFNGKGDHVVTDWMGIGDDDPRSVAFWARIPPGAKAYDTACVVWGYRPPGKETVNRKWNVQLAMDQKTRSRYIVNTTFGGLWMEGRKPLDDGKWHHVSAVYTGRNRADGMPDLRLFVDGAPETGEWVWNNPIDRSDGEVRVRTEIQEKLGAQPLALARTMHQKSGGPGFFKGELDEVYVIAGALRPEDIQSLYHYNRIDPGPVIQKVVVAQEADAQ